MQNYAFAHNNFINNIYKHNKIKLICSKNKTSITFKYDIIILEVNYEK